VEIIQTKNKVALETFRENDLMTKIKEHFGIIDGKKTVEKLTFKH
jgi:predicted SnoaL-like aldol condensation-catalyzing enzyme